MAKNEGIGLPQTRGTFQVSGLVVGVEKENSYKETKTKTTQKPWRILNFSVKTNKDSTIYLNLSGGEQDEVYFSKSETKDGKKTVTTEKVQWKDRFKFNKEGFRLIGVNTGVKKILNKDGKTVNDKKILTPYDATREVHENLRDNQSVFVKGSVEYSHFTKDDNTVKNSIKFIPNQISLCKDIDFEDEKFTPTCEFTQHIVFMGISQDEKNRDKFIVSAKIVNFNSIEDAEFIITDKNLANIFKKNLKPYTGIKVWGKINVTTEVEEVETDNWGSENKMEKVNAPTIRELEITGAEKTSVDIETYSKDKIEEAIEKINASKKAENDFGDTNWGNKQNTDDEEPAW